MALQQRLKITQPSMLSPKTFLVLEKGERLQCITANLNLINHYLPPTSRLDLRDFAKLAASSDEITTSYAGTYLMTLWLITAIYLQNSAFGSTSSASSILYELLMLPCCRAMTDLYSYRNTFSIFVALKTYLKSAFGVTSADILNAVQAERPRAVQFTDIVNPSVQFLYASILRRGSTSYWRTRANRTSEESWYQGVLNRFKSVNNALERFKFYYAVGYMAPNNTSVFPHQKYADVLVQRPSLADDSPPPWLRKMLFIPLAEDERPFDAHGLNRFYEFKPGWYEVAINEAYDNVRNASYTKSTKTNVADTIRREAETLFANEDITAPEDLVSGTSLTQPSPPADLGLPNNPNGSIIPPSSKLTKIALALASATTAVLLARYVNRKWHAKNEIVTV